MNIDEKYMEIAIRLAKRADGLTNPNPIVGAVVVRNKKIVGKGYHKRCGLPHAEVMALNDAGEAVKGATLYVTLEPCDHFGRTPPCTNAIIDSGVRRVVIGMKDPNPINNGRGIKKLNMFGIRAIAGTLEEEAMLINRPYIKFITKKMPYVTVKVAESLDGKIATRTGDSRWVSCEASRQYVHALRGKVDAVMVGANTVIRDDPLLLSKGSGSKQPIRIVVDGQLKIPTSAKLISSSRRSKVIIATTRRAPPSKIKLFKAEGAEVLILKSKEGKIDIGALLNILGKKNIMHILVEGGGELIANLIEKRLADRFLFFVASKIIGGRDAITSVEGRGIDRVASAYTLKDLKVKKVGTDILFEAIAG